MSKALFKTRRSMLRSSFAGAAAVLFAGVPLSKGRAADAPEVSEHDPTAKGLKYVADATKSQRTDMSAFCHNCRYFKGAADAPKAPCDLFGGKVVSGTLEKKKNRINFFTCLET